MSDCNLTLLIKAGVVPKEFEEAKRFLDEIDKLDPAEVQRLIEIGKKIEGFRLSIEGPNKILWC
ncbi:MAG: hypothetical protein AAGF23_23830 [Acidobacteriota bacterium]